MSVIEFDFAKARQQQQELDSIAQEISSVGNQSMEEVISGISAAWSGDNAQAYLGKAEKLQEQLVNTSRKVQNVSGALRIITEALQQAEEAAKEIASTSGGGR